MRGQHILLTALGKVAKPCQYMLTAGGQTVEAALAPSALMQLLPAGGRPDRVLALCTQDAATTTWPTLASDTRAFLGVNAERLDIPDGRNEAEIREIIEIAAGAFPEGAELTLDVTQGYRHFPFIAYALTLYLISLRGIRLRGAFYGMVEGATPGDPCPIVDVGALLVLPDWFHAVRVFRETGAMGPLTELLRRSSGASIKDRAVQAIIADSAELSFAYESALPLEIGAAADRLCSLLAEGFPASLSSVVPLAGALSRFVIDSCASFRFGADIAGATRRIGLWKESVALGEQELRRQADLIDLYLRRSQLPLALGLMREWVVSYVLLQDQRGDRWLDNSRNGARSAAERRLGALAAIERDKKGRDDASIVLTDEQKRWAKFWNQLTELRNELHHHGMKKNVVGANPSALERVQEFWGDLKILNMLVPRVGGGTGRLLLSALGTTPGVLFSALRCVGDAARCIIVCSDKTEPAIAEATTRAGFQGETKALTISDPHGGYTPDEQSRFRAASSRWLLEADEIAVNLTGGTTLMGMAVQHLMDRGRDLDRVCRRFVLVDRRAPELQRTDPYVEGEIRWVDPPT
jgi:hypothetical protein